MKNTKWMTMGLVPVLALSITACASEGNGSKVAVREPGHTITVIEDEGTESGAPEAVIEKMDKYENLDISDWLDADRVIVAMENESLGRMELSELADQYPRSLYEYNLATNEYRLLRERANAHLGSAMLSPDKKHMIYQEYSLGDPVFYVMNLDSKEEFRLSGEPIGGAISAKWADSSTIIGASYGGGAYIASTDGNIRTVEGLDGAMLFIVETMKDRIYYNTGSDETLMVLNTKSLAVADMNLGSVHGVYPAPDGSGLLVLQYNGNKTALLLADPDGEEPKSIAEGAEISGVSWSPDQRMIAYVMKSNGNGGGGKGLYVHDLLTGKTTQIAVQIDNATTLWSPSGNKLAFAEWNGDAYVSQVVHLQFSWQKN